MERPRRSGGGCNNCIDHLAEQGYLRQPQDNTDALEALDLLRMALESHVWVGMYDDDFETIRKALECK